MKKFTVRRSEWRRGGTRYDNSKGATFLLNEVGYMCCLGFATNQICRITKKDLLEMDTPSCVLPYKSTFTDEHGDNNDLTNRAISINDASNISDKVREERLTALFKKHGIKVTFKD